MMKTMSKDELSEKFGLIQDVVELDLQELNKKLLMKKLLLKLKKKILYSKKRLNS